MSAAYLIAQLKVTNSENYKEYIEKVPEIIKKYGEEEFKKIEEQTMLDIDFSKQNIVSTGGSVIYYEKGMEYLDNNNILPTIKFIF